MVQDVEQAEQFLHPLPAQKDVGVDVQVFGKGQVLIDGLDAEGEGVHGIGDFDLPVHEKDAALVGVVHA